MKVQSTYRNEIDCSDKRDHLSLLIIDSFENRISLDAQLHNLIYTLICSIANKIGCTPETLRRWCKEAVEPPVTSSGSQPERERLKQLERENRKLKRANEILRKAAAFFAQAELDRKPKPW